MNSSGGATQAQGFMSKLNMFKGGFSTTHIMYLLAAAVFVILAAAFYHYYLKPKFLQPSFNPNSEHMKHDEDDGKVAEIMLFYVDWCPHCKTAKPVWEEVKAEYQNKTINGYKVLFTEINCTTESDEVEQLLNKYKIEGFPTIKLLKDGQVVEYDAKTTKDTLVQFLNTVL